MKIISWKIPVSLVVYIILIHHSFVVSTLEVTSKNQVNNENGHKRNTDEISNGKDLILGKIRNETNSSNQETTEKTHDLVNSSEPTERQSGVVIERVSEDLNVNTNSEEEISKDQNAQTNESEGKHESSISSSTPDETSVPHKESSFNETLKAKSKELEKQISETNKNIQSTLCSFFSKFKCASDKMIKQTNQEIKKFQDITTVQFLSSYKSKSLMELFYDMSLIFKEINKTFHETNVLDFKKYQPLLDAIAPHLWRKGNKKWRVYLYLKIHMTDRLEMWSLQHILSKPYHKLPENPSKQDIDELFEQILKLYKGFFVIPYSPSDARLMQIGFHLFSKRRFVQTALNMINATMTCEQVECGDHSTCYMVDGKPQCKCVLGYTDVSENGKTTCKKVTPATCKIYNGGCCREATCVNESGDIYCQYDFEEYIGDGVMCTKVADKVQMFL